MFSIDKKGDRILNKLDRLPNKIIKLNKIQRLENSRNNLIMVEYKGITDTLSLPEIIILIANEINRLKENNSR